MDEAIEREILARFAAPRDAAPAPPTEPALHAHEYRDPARLAREEERVFRRAWVPAALTHDLAAPGACRTLDLGSEPLVAVTDVDGTRRVLRNVCLHRGAQIVRAPAAELRSLRCPYHGLDYGLDGRLRACPAPASFPEHCRPGNAGLAEVRSAEFGGWLWACLDASAPSLEAALGEDLLAELRGYPLAELTPVAVREFEGAFDWKVGIEAFLEPLHVPAMHGRSAHPLVDYRGLAVRSLGEHSRMALPFRVPSAYAPHGVLGEAAHSAGVPWFAGLCRVQREAHLVYHVFPALILMLFPNHLLALRFLPVGLARCSVRWELRALPAAGPAAEAWLASLVPGYEQLIEEDMENLPWIQRGLASPSLGPLALSGYEARIAHFRAALARRLEG